ncbi:hypothetical protein TNCV_760211 [Trichonephila clavipes]|nr:hypothetical protein TNCV_760211 [Trichonephila clavipes]
MFCLCVSDGREFCQDACNYTVWRLDTLDLRLESWSVLSFRTAIKGKLSNRVTIALVTQSTLQGVECCLGRRDQRIRLQLNTYGISLGDQSRCLHSQH